MAARVLHPEEGHGLTSDTYGRYQYSVHLGEDICLLSLRPRGLRHANGNFGGARRIIGGLVEDECDLLRRQWAGSARNDDAYVVATAIGDSKAPLQFDRFDLVQLAEVIRVCQTSRPLSEAGRTLFAASREKKTSANDADRLKKYLARFGLKFGDLSV